MDEIPGPEDIGGSDVVGGAGPAMIYEVDAFQKLTS